MWFGLVDVGTFGGGLMDRSSGGGAPGAGMSPLLDVNRGSAC